MHERRALLKFIAASPLSLFPDLAHAVQTGGLEPAAHALDVFDFEAAAQKVVPPAHWGCLMSGWTGTRPSAPSGQASLATS